MLQLGTVEAVLVLTAAAEVMAVGLDWIFLHLSPFPPSTYKASLTMAAILPLIVAPILGGVIMVLLQEVEESRRDLERLAIRDGLTMLYNRTYFMELLRREISKAHRYRAQLSLLMFDADDFKRVNDQHGHSVGDTVLESIARVCSGLLREHDVLARYGGEEFVLLLPGTASAGACQVAERLREAMERMEVRLENPEEVVRITVSIGIASVSNEEDTVDTLFSRADGALYRSKQSGKNRWTAL